MITSPYCQLTEGCERPREGNTLGCSTCNHAKRKELRQLSKPIKVTRIKPRTAKRAAQEARYLKRRVEWLAEHDKCEVTFCMNKSTEVHHMLHRRGEMIMNEYYWMAVCPTCHERITRDSKWAKENGYSYDRNQKTEI